MICLLACNPRLCKFVAVELDDVLIHSSTREEHVHHVWIMLDRLQQAGCKLKSSNCEWFRDEIEFWGFQINPVGVHMLESMTRAVTEWTWPCDMKEVDGFLGSMGYYHRFIRHYAHITSRLYQMCKMSLKVRMRGCCGEPRLKDVGTAQFG